MKKTINILICQDFSSEKFPNFPSHDQFFKNLFNTVQNQNIDYKTYLVYNNEFPTVLSQSELYVISGSLASACDDTEWIINLINWIKKANDLKLKMVGMCFGHQIIARALGGKVIRSPKGVGVGIRTSNVVEEKIKNNYFKDGKIRLLYFHYDQVVELPANAKCTISDDFCEIGGFTLDDRIVTFQGHPEFSKEFVEFAIIKFSELDKDKKDMAIDSIRKNKTDELIVAKLIIDLL